MPASRTCRLAIRGSTRSAPGSAAALKAVLTSRPSAPLDTSSIRSHLRLVLVGELHGHTATKRVPNHRSLIVTESLEKVTKHTRERTQRIVGTWIIRLATTEQIRGDDVGMLSKGQGWPGPRSRCYS